MKTPRYNDAQIVTILKEANDGIAVPELCRKHGMSNATFYKWRAKYGGLDVSTISKLKSLEEELRRYKKMYAEAQFDADILKEVLAKK